MRVSFFGIQNSAYRSAFFSYLCVLFEFVSQNFSWQINLSLFMEVLGHFIFELIKITILGFIYSLILYYLLKIISNTAKWSWPENFKISRFYLWIFISFFLLCYMFTPFGDHGLGDSARIPISYTKEINNVNWTEFARINDVKSSDENEIEMTNFKITDNIVCGNLKSSFYTYNNSFFIYNIDLEKLIKFSSQKEYNFFATKNNYPKSNELISFEENYRNYWIGCRFFLLP